MATGSRIGVLHMISGLGVGGAERMLVWSARHHDRERFRMGVVSLMSGGEMAGAIRETGVPLYEMGQGRGRLSLSTLRRLQAIVRTFDPQILQGHMFHSNILVRILGVGKRDVVVLSTRHIDQASPARRYANALTGFAGDGTIVFSRRVQEAEQRENLFRKPVRLVPYGIEVPIHGPDGPGLREELGVGAGAFLWVAAGRLTRQKGFEDLMDAFHRLLEKAPGTRLLIVGEGEEGPRLRRRAREKGMEGKVLFPGARPDLDRILGSGDAFVLSSLWEGGPLVVLEAMAAGLPVVATRVGDTPSMVVDGTTGLLVDPGKPAHLAEAMSRVMALGPAVSDWGRLGRLRVLERYDFRRVQRELETWYADLAGPVRREGA